MHSHIDAENGVTIKYNPDLSGNALIKTAGKELEVPAKTLAGFAKRIIIDLMIEKIEQGEVTSLEQILNELPTQ